MPGFCLLQLLRPGRSTAGSAFRWGETPVSTLHFIIKPVVLFIIKPVSTDPCKGLALSWGKLAELQQISRNKNLEKSLKPQQLLGLAQYSTACKNTAAWSWDDSDGLIFFVISWVFLGFFFVRMKIFRQELWSCSPGGTGLDGFVFLWKLIAEDYPNLQEWSHYMWGCATGAKV